MNKALQIRDLESTSIYWRRFTNHAEARIKEFSVIKDNHLTDARPYGGSTWCDVCGSVTHCTSSFLKKIPCSFVQNSAGSRPPMVSDFIPSVAYTKSTNKLPYKFSQKKKEYIQCWCVTGHTHTCRCRPGMSKQRSKLVMTQASCGNTVGCMCVFEYGSRSCSPTV